jgi:hypothetical protein
MLPARIPTPRTLRAALRQSPTYPVTRWLNAYRVCDYVGQALVVNPFLGWTGLGPRPQDAESGIHDVLLRPWARWPLGHANYWGDPRFLDLVAREILAPVLEAAPGAPMTTTS